jgi:hypothetical protein
VSYSGVRKFSPVNFLTVRPAKRLGRGKGTAGTEVVITCWLVVPVAYLRDADEFGI